MKPGLRRIEATLDQLEVQNDSSVGIATDHFKSGNTDSGVTDGVVTDSSQADSLIWDELWDTQTSVSLASAPPAKPKSKIQVEPFPVPDGKPDIALEAPSVGQGGMGQGAMGQGAMGYIPTKEHTEARLPVLPIDQTVSQQTVPHPAVSPGSASVPPAHSSVQSALLTSELPGLSVNRQAANPNLALGMLKEVETLVRGWQKELEQTVQQIQGIYQDGPIVDGWLESYPPGGQAAPPSASISMLRHAEIEYLMEFIEQICEAEQAQITEDMRRTNYRLCGLDPDGKMWSRPCPPEQVPYVGLAIARYQKLRTLLTKKQLLENRLTSLVEALTMLHGQIRD